MKRIAWAASKLYMKFESNRATRNTSNRAPKVALEEERRRKKTTNLAQKRDFQSFITFFLDRISTRSKRLRIYLLVIYAYAKFGIHKPYQRASM